MKAERSRMQLGAVGAFGAAVLLASPAQAQFNGSHLLGDFGVRAGTQPTPGFYASGVYYRYGTESLRDRNGDEIAPAPGEGDLDIAAYGPILWYVGAAKVLGANYGAMAVIPIAAGSLEAAILGIDSGTGTHFADAYLRPLDLGWHTSRADIVAGFGLYAPTGKYEQGGSSNTGKGMWTSEPFVGTTLHLDPKRSWSLAANAFWEIHGTKRDSDTKVGQILTLEGGLGKSYLGGGVVIGAAYYAQWKLTPDTVDVFDPAGNRLGSAELATRHRVYALGPDVTLPVASKTKLYSLVNLRYLWEMGAKTRTQGQSLLVTATFPVPAVTLR